MDMPSRNYPDQHDGAHEEAPHGQSHPGVDPEQSGLPEEGSNPPTDHGGQSEDERGDFHGITPFFGK